MSVQSDSPRNGVGLPATPIRVLVVEDSPVARMLLVDLIESDPQLRLAGVAADGEEGVAAAARLRPDVIVMDIHMPKVDGFVAARQIMETSPTRIVMVTASTEPQDVAATFRALEAGALAVIAKPVGPGSPVYEACAAVLIQTVKSMAEVPVVKRWPRPPAAVSAAAVPRAVPAVDVRVVALGASTGGPVVLQQILSQLPKDFAAPVLIVQHISDGFAEGFAQWLALSSGYPVQVATHGQRATGGSAYVAPCGVHMGLATNGSIELTDAPAEYGLKPSVSYLFRSLQANFGPAAIAVLLTGMGRDGARELKALREAGAVTMAQDRDTAIIFGMPGEAVKLAAATYVLDPDAIAALLQRLVGYQAGNRPRPEAAPTGEENRA